MRILVANSPRLFRESLALAVADWEGMEVAVEDPNDEEILSALGVFSPEVVILSFERYPEAPPLCTRLFHGCPHLTILATGFPQDPVHSFWFDRKIHSRRMAGSQEALQRFLARRGMAKTKDQESLGVSSAAPSPS